MTPHKERSAFFAVPFIATVAWYAVTLIYVGAVNGRIRLMTDVVAFAIGAVMVTLPAMIIVTIMFAAPIYWLVRRTLGVTLLSALAGGAIIGAGTTMFFTGLTHDSSVLSPTHGIAIGLVTALAWWQLAGKPGPAGHKLKGT